MSARDKQKVAIAVERESPPGKYRDVIEAAKKRGLDDLYIRKDCPCPNWDCPHKGNCLACTLYHHMMQVIGAGKRMVLPACSYFSERDYWLEKRRSANSPELKEAVDEWLAYNRDMFNLRRDMSRNRELMEEFDKVFEDMVNKTWIETFANKTAEQREQRIAENKKIDKEVPGVYPYK